MSFLEYYFNCARQYSDSIVLIQKGKFYECYQFQNVGKAFELGNIVNTTITLCNKNKEPSFVNPYMAGFQIGYIDRNIPIILEHQYNIVLIDEDPNDVTVRNIKAIYSPGTYTEKSCVSNNIVCIYIEQHLHDCFISLASIDLATGTSTLFEIHKGNNTMKLEECYRINESQNPSEVLIVSNKQLRSEFSIVFESSHRKICHLEYNSNIAQLAYQNSTLKEVYNIQSFMSPIEFLNLELHSFACYAFVFLLDYCISHNKQVVYNLNYPKFENFENKMILHNNSIYQLNIINHTKDKSLLKVLDNTSTSMGKRLLYSTLLNPVSDPIYLQKMYDEIESMIPLYDTYEQKLKCIVDVEKLHRKMGLERLKPFELWNLYNSYENLLWILQREEEIIYNKFLEYFQSVQNVFLVENLRDHKDYEINIFKHGVYNEIDALFDKIQCIDEELNDICKKINSYLPSNAKVKLGCEHIETTQARSKKILEYTKDYTFVVENKTRTLIKNSKIDSLFHEKSKTRSLLKPRIERFYTQTLGSLYSKYKPVFQTVHYIIAYTDLKKSKAKTAVLYNYTKPTLSNTHGLYINGMKHPIITRLDSNCVTFDPYQVKFSESQNGMLLYGVNGSGKSTYSKSIALNVVLAQSGHYVCADNMVYKPYERLYTRLGDADNIYKGQSSFFVEMSELKSILHYADQNSLIIGDEPCRGTEDNSALSIVSYTIESLLEKKSTFVFATHLHMLTEISCIKDHPQLMIKHVGVSYNSENILVYTHNVVDGKCKRNYGLEIAQKVLNLDSFTTRTNELFNEITKKPTKKRSRYNKNLYVQKCEICNATENLHTHHIIFQHTFDENSVNKNDINNLVVLCEKHHVMTHQNKLIINGWKQSIQGRFLDYILV